MALTQDIDHKDIPVGEIHGLVNWLVPDLPSLGNIVPAAGDLYKAALVTVPGGYEIKILVGIAPTEWIDFNAPQDLSEYLVTSSPSDITASLAVWTHAINDLGFEMLKRMKAVGSVAAAKLLTNIAVGETVFIGDDGGGGSTFYKLDQGNTDPHNPPTTIVTDAGQRLVPRGIHYPVSQYVIDQVALAVAPLFADADPLPQYQLRTQPPEDIVVDVSNNWSPVSTDAGKTKIATGLTHVVIPEDATENFELGFHFEVFREGAGDVDFVPENVNITILEKNTDLTIPNQFAGRTIMKMRANVWWLI